ncbi:MAG: response regulator, partial [Myxococcota bacterium]
MSRTVLIIEDDPAVAGLLKDVLNADGYETTMAADGETGLDIFAESNFDAVIVDVLLPRIQGFDVLPRLRKLPGGADVPIVMVSADLRGDSYAERMEARHNIAAFLQKPVDLERLRDVLRQQTDLRRSGQIKSDPSQPPLAPSSEYREPPPLTAPLDGSLESIPFARILGGIFSERLTGALRLRKASVKKLIYFENGIPVFVKSNLLHECLGRVMVAERMITQEACDRSLTRKQHEPHKRQGELLVEMGSISPHNLEFALELQMQAKLFDVFSWMEGRYQFNANVRFEGEPVALSMGPALLLYEGASRSMSTDRIRRDLSVAGEWMLVPSSEASLRYQALQLEPRADRFLDCIDGS